MHMKRMTRVSIELVQCEDKTLGLTGAEYVWSKVADSVRPDPGEDTTGQCKKASTLFQRCEDVGHGALSKHARNRPT